MDGDLVMYRIKPWQVYGEVLEILEHVHKRIVGTYVSNGKRLEFLPDNEKLKWLRYRLNVPKDFTPIDGLKVEFAVTKYGNINDLEYVSTIGHKDDPGVDIEAILLENDIITEFPEEVLEEIKGIPQEVSEEETAGRTDLTGETVVTIDGDDSKDFDDAVGVTKTEYGWLLKVSIADVSHYVQEGTPLDREAYNRGCSTYVTDRVVPMIPHELSNGICSLNPHVIRLTLTCEMEVTQNGTIRDYRIYPSFIRSAERMTYRNVNQILKNNKELCEQYAHLGSLFTDLRDCADAIRSSRMAKGAINFDGTESDILCDEDGTPYYVGPKKRGHAEEIIEDCMIAANVCTANYMKWQEIPGIYRIHEEPQYKRIRTFQQISYNLGHKLIVGQNAIHPSELQKYMDSIRDTEEFAALSKLLLRCMSKARYDASCVGHFGLAEEEYLHFTSPIRRYPDLIVHRMLRKYAFERCTDVNEIRQDERKAVDYAEQSSVRERASQSAEYAVDDMKKAEYMAGFIGKTYNAIVTSVTSYGLYAELSNTCEGLISVYTLGYCEFDSSRMELKEENSGKVYRIGDRVKVRVTGASKENAAVDLEIVRGKADNRRGGYHGRKKQ